MQNGAYHSVHVGTVQSIIKHPLVCLSNINIFFQLHTGKCMCQFGGIYAYCRYFVDRKWKILALILYR